MLTLVQLKENDIKGWIQAKNKEDLMEQLADIEPFDDNIKIILNKVNRLKNIPYGKHTLQPGTYLLASL